MCKYIAPLLTLLSVVVPFSDCNATDGVTEPELKIRKVAAEGAEAPAVESEVPTFPADCLLPKDVFYYMLAECDVLTLREVARTNKVIGLYAEDFCRRRCASMGMTTHQPMMFSGLTPWFSCYANETYFRELLNVNVVCKDGTLVKPTAEQKKLLDAFVRYYQYKAPSISIHIAMGANSLLLNRHDYQRAYFWTQWDGRKYELEKFNGFTFRHEICLIMSCDSDRENINWISREYFEGDEVPGGAQESLSYLVAGTFQSHRSLQCIANYLVRIYTNSKATIPVCKYQEPAVLRRIFLKRLMDSLPAECAKYLPEGAVPDQVTELSNGLQDIVLTNNQ